MISDEEQALKFFRYLQRLKRQKEDQKYEELRLKMNLKHVKNFVMSNVEEQAGWQWVQQSRL